jgi:DNA replicative helicase MCM subunit Mcm2 (Cdc46/Mcm family)
MLDAFWALAHHITMAPLTSPGDSSQQEVGNSEQHQEPNTDWTAEQLVHASYKDLGSPAQVEERFLRHLLLSPTCRHSLEVLLTESSTTTRDYSITVDAFDLLEGDPILGHLLLRYPATLLPLLENAVVGAQGALARELQERADAHNAGMNEESQSQSQSQSQLPLPDGSHNPPERTPIIMSLLPPMMVKGCCRQSSDGNGNGSAATRVHARLVHLPPTCCKTSLGSLQAEDVGKVFQISGTVVRAGPVQMYESARTYKCTTGGGGGGGGGGAKAKQKSGGCGRTFVAHADMEQRNNALVPPDRCPLLVPDGNERCPGSKLEAVEGGSVHTDYQEIKIQEAASSLAIGHIPRSLLIKLQHDLVDHCQPGDEVVVVGSLLAQWHQQTVLPDVDCQIGMAMSAHSVRVIQEKGSSAWKNTAGANSVGEQDNLRKEFDAYWSEERNQLYPMLARDFICKSVCPKLYGMKIIKLALLITLIGGVSSDAYQDKNESKDKSLPRNHADYSDDDDDDEPEPFQAVLDDKSKQTQVAAYYGDENTRRSSKQKGYKDDAVKTRRRDQSHLLLVGDPGTGTCREVSCRDGCRRWDAVMLQQVLSSYYYTHFHYFVHLHSCTINTQVNPKCSGLLRPCAHDPCSPRE